MNEVQTNEQSPIMTWSHVRPGDMLMWKASGLGVGDLHSGWLVLAVQSERWEEYVDVTALRLWSNYDTDNTIDVFRDRASCAKIGGEWSCRRAVNG